MKALSLIILSLISLNLFASSTELINFHNIFSKLDCSSKSFGVERMSSLPESFLEELISEGEHREGDDPYFQIFTEKQEVIEQLLYALGRCDKSTDAIEALILLSLSEQLFAAFLGGFYIEGDSSSQDYTIIMSSGEYLKLRFN